MQDVLDIVKALTSTDTKSLTATALKTAEEVGELAKVILPYENGFATTHRFVTDSCILEEAVDTMLCALSIAYKLNYTDNDIRDMMIEKCKKWDYLQRQSEKGAFPIPFEIHISVSITQEMVESFTSVCALANVKPIVLELKEGLFDVMTSSVIITDNAGAYNEMKRISDIMRYNTFVVVREKIETVPWHPAAPTQINYINSNQYFECHFNILLNNVEFEKIKAYNIKAEHNLHFSKNINKQVNDIDFLQMATFRSSNCSKQLHWTAVLFESKIGEIRKSLEESGILREGAIAKQIVEYCLYDTNINHDIQWVQSDRGV